MNPDPNYSTLATTTVSIKGMPELTPTQVYNLLSAVRGPDKWALPTDMLKSQITCRLRSILFNREVPGLVSDYPMTEMSLKSTEDALAKLVRENYHFVQHLCHAVRATESHLIWGGYGSALSTLLEKTIDKL